MAEEDEAGIPHLAGRLNTLFARVPRRGGGQLYSNERAAEELSAAGIPVTGAYLWQLRAGRRTNPSARLLNGIAELFGVPITYFFDEGEAARVEAQLEALAALRSSGVQGIVARAAGVSDAGLANLSAILEHIRKMEGLDEEGDRTHG